MKSFKIIFWGTFCICLGIHKLMSSNSYNTEDFLTENVYHIVNTAYSFDLPRYINALQDNDRYEETGGMGVNKFTRAFSFIKKDNGYLIKNLCDDNYLYYSKKELDYRKFHNENPKNFLWKLNFIQASIYKITPLEGEDFLVIKKITNSGSKGQKSITYELKVDREERNETNILGDYCFDTLTSEWRLNPFYPSSGYSDFFKIIKDCGDLIALKYKTGLRGIKTSPTSSHDFACLSVQCLDKTRIRLSPHSPHYKPSKREIFSIEDVFKSNPAIDSSGSVVKITRAIETEEIFQTTIENSLTTLRRELKTTNERNIRRKTQEEGEDLEKMDQTGFSQSLNTLLSISVSQGIDISNTTGNRQSTTVGESTQHSSHQDTGTSTFTGIVNDTGTASSKGTVHDTGYSNTHGKANTQSLGVDTSVSAGFNAGFASGNASVGIHANETNQTSSNYTNTQNTQKNSNDTTTQNMQKSSNVTGSTNSGTSLSEQKNKEKTKERFDEQTNRISNAKETQNQTGEVREERKDQMMKSGQKNILTHEDIIEQEQSQELGIEQSLNLTEIRSVTQRKSEKWFIEREFQHIPNTTLQVKFYEEAVEAINYPFEVSLQISGYIGFTFDENILIGYHPRRDYLAGNTWFLSPATILNYLKAPGYKANEDGSINYIVKGKLNLKHPLKIFTVIGQDTLLSKSYEQENLLENQSIDYEPQKFLNNQTNISNKRKRELSSLTKNSTTDF